MNGSDAATAPLWDVQNGGRMMVLDAWFEGETARAAQLTGTGTFTYWNGLLAPYSSTPVAPVIELNGFSGVATFAGITFDLFGNTARAISVTNENSQTRALFIGLTGYVAPYFNRTGSGGTVSFMQSKYYDPAGGICRSPIRAALGPTLKFEPT